MRIVLAGALFSLLLGGGCGGRSGGLPGEPEDASSLRDGAVDTAQADGAVIGTWVTIPAGTFMMGSPASEPCRRSFEDLHQVTLTHAFEMQSTEVTQGQFKSLMGYNPSLFKACGSTCPVDMVAWDEAVSYCNALSAKAGLAKCYTCSGSGKTVSCKEAASCSGQKIYDCPGFRLPTEAEWEHAYRAGTKTAFYSGPIDARACWSCAGEARVDRIA